MGASRRNGLRNKHLITQTTTPAKSDQPRSKRVLFPIISILLGLLVALTAAELILGYLKNHIEQSDRMDPGMMLYDMRMGWRLKPHWTGRHEHFDFEAVYSINRYGFRGDFRETSDKDGKTFAVVGDSFSFGLGVNDSDTFAEQLNSRAGQKHVYLNFSVPGYSTDQELLLVEQRVLVFEPDVILLVVYLGNDLFDNELGFPLQANNAKPYFMLDGDGLVLKNSPVPLETKPTERVKIDLSRVVMGEVDDGTGVLTRQLRRFELFRLLETPFRRYPELSNHFEVTFDYRLRLFEAIVEKLKSLCDRSGIELKIMLMPGRSFVQDPGTPSQQFQDYLRIGVLSAGERIEVDVMDLAQHLKQRYQEDGEKMLFPNEGHLTARGHEVVAEYLAALTAD
jgi:hypothetical protein